MAELVTLNEVKSYLDINSNTYDAKLTNCIVFATSLMESYCGRGFTVANVEYEYHDGGKPFIHLNRIPVNNVFSVAQYDGGQYVELNMPAIGGGLPNVASNASLAAGFSIDYESGKIWKGTTVLTSDSLAGLQAFSPYAGGIRVSYNGGYVSVPSDLKLCCILIVKDLHKGLNNQRTKFAQEEVEQMPYSGGFPPHIRRILDLYRIII